MRALCVALLLIIAAAAAADSDVARIVDSHFDRIPQHTIAPEYPRKARRDRIEGEVTVCFEIDRRGSPRRIAVRRSTNSQFEKPSIRAVRASSFKPLAKGEPLPAIKACRTFVFSLVPLEE